MYKESGKEKQIDYLSLNESFSKEKELSKNKKIKNIRIIKIK